MYSMQYVTVPLTKLELNTRPFISLQAVTGHQHLRKALVSGSNLNQILSTGLANAEVLAPLAPVPRVIIRQEVSDD